MEELHVAVSLRPRVLHQCLVCGVNTGSSAVEHKNKDRRRKQTTFLAVCAAGPESK